MSTAPFTYPDEAEFLTEFGSETVCAGPDEPWIRTLTIPISGSEELLLSFDKVAASIRFEWTVSGRILFSMYREKAVQLSLVTENGTTGFSVEFDSMELGGALVVQAYPHVTISDSLLVR